MKTYIRYIVTAISITLAIVTIVSTLFIILVTTLATLVDIVEDTLEEPTIEANNTPTPITDEPTTPVIEPSDETTHEPIIVEVDVIEATPIEALTWPALQKLAKVLGVKGRKKVDILAGLALVAPGTVSDALRELQ